MRNEDPFFAERYGPWAVVAGASDGVGAAFAHAMAERGINVVLLARRLSLLDEVAEGIRAASGVEVRTASIDLAADDALAQVSTVTAGLDVGMFLYCAGADSSYTGFLESPPEYSLAMVHRNCVVPMQLSHHFAGPMVDRRRGGIVLVGSAAGAFPGTPNSAVYGATKAFDLALAEGLWTELHTQGVDVLGLVIGATDTPALRRLLVRLGRLADVDDPAPVPGAMSAEATVAEAIENLENGPTWFVGEAQRAQAQMFQGMSRSEVVHHRVRSAGGAGAIGRSDR